MEEGEQGANRTRCASFDFNPSSNIPSATVITGTLFRALQSRPVFKLEACVSWANTSLGASSSRRPTWETYTVQSTVHTLVLPSFLVSEADTLDQQLAWPSTWLLTVLSSPAGTVCCPQLLMLPGAALLLAITSPSSICIHQNPSKVNYTRACFFIIAHSHCCMW